MAVLSEEKRPQDELYTHPAGAGVKSFTFQISKIHAFIK